MTTWLDVAATILATGWVVWAICHVDGQLLNGCRRRGWRRWGRIR